MKTVTILYGTPIEEPWNEYILAVYSSRTAAEQAMIDFGKERWKDFRFETWEVRD